MTHTEGLDTVEVAAGVFPLVGEDPGEHRHTLGQSEHSRSEIQMTPALSYSIKTLLKAPKAT